MPKEIEYGSNNSKIQKPPDSKQTQGRLELQLDFQEKLPMLKGGNFPFS